MNDRMNSSPPEEAPPTDARLEPDMKTMEDRGELSQSSQSHEGSSTLLQSSTLHDLHIRKENRFVWSLRVALLLLLGCAAVGVCVRSYRVARAREVTSFEEDFADLGTKLVRTFEATLSQRIGAVDSFSRHITSEVQHNPTMEWPFVTVPDFEYRAGSVAKLADVVNMVLVVRVEGDERQDWETYSVENQGWRAEGLLVQHEKIVAKYPEQTEFEDPLADLLPIKSSIQMAGGGAPVNETGDGPYFVAWQNYPAIPKALANMNLLKRPAGKFLAEVNQTGQAILGESVHFINNTESNRYIDFSAFIKQYEDEDEGVLYEADPVANFFYPVFDTIGRDRTRVQAVLMSSIYWRTYFTRVLLKGHSGLVAILENTCNQTYTYQISGEEAHFVDEGDLHKSEYDHLKISSGSIDVNFDEFRQTTDSTDRFACSYSLRVYPSEELEQYHKSDDPIRQTVAIGAVFLVTATVFILYDFCVERRQRVVAKMAIQAGAVVSSLFPEAVRDRLYKAQDRALANKGDSTDTRGWETAGEPALLLPPSDDSSRQRGGIIADMHPDCTILFADLVGFTNWATGHSPTEVFELLETIYGAFDLVAVRRRIFKVETIGDCYVAATGLPSPQPLHAVKMAKFADECMRKLEELLKGTLVERLGEDTANLGMRFGLHSGPVTAGVLRGQKSRFQIFGDTVNTAARIESTGMKGKIHVSPSTAALLRVEGKESWLTARDHIIKPKGKGDMQTYWVAVGGAAGIYSGRKPSTLGSSDKE